MTQDRIAAPSAAPIATGNRVCTEPSERAVAVPSRTRWLITWRTRPMAIARAVERRVDGGNRFVVILRAPGERPSSAAHRPRAHADRGQLHVAVAEPFLDHLFYNNEVL